MKRLIVFFISLCLGMSYADTVNIDWVSDGNIYAQTTCEIGGDLEIPTTNPIKPGYTFRGWKIKGYTPIEYLEGVSNVQYINTGIIPTSSMNMYGKFMFISRQENSNASFFGARNSSNYTGVYAWLTPSLIKAQWFLTSESQRLEVSETNQSGNIYEYSFVNSTVMIKKNDIPIASKTFIPQGTILYPIYINAINNAGVPDSNKSATNRIYHFTVEGVADFIPVLDDNNIPCMFDKVSGQFFYNAGTGGFIAGPVINE